MKLQKLKCQYFFGKKWHYLIIECTGKPDRYHVYKTHEFGSNEDPLSLIANQFRLSQAEVIIEFYEAGQYLHTGLTLSEFIAATRKRTAKWEEGE